MKALPPNTISSLIVKFLTIKSPYSVSSPFLTLNPSFSFFSIWSPTFHVLDGVPSYVRGVPLTSFNPCITLKSVEVIDPAMVDVAIGRE